MDAGSWESHCSCLLISTVTFTNIVPRTRNDFLQCKSVRKQAEKLIDCVHVLPVEGERRVYNWWCKWFAQYIWSSVQRHWWYTEHEEFSYMKRSNRFIIPDSDVFYLHQIPISSLWIWTQWINISVCLRATEWLLTLTQSSRIMIIQTDLIIIFSVLCRESVCGRCYWELEWSGGDYGVRISVSYKSISRKGSGKMCLFGNNDQSWSLHCNPPRYSFIQNNIRTDLPVKPISSRIGVYVDHSEGTLSFYSVSDTMSLIHTVQTTFTQPLYPGFYVSRRSSVKVCWWIRRELMRDSTIMLWAVW